MRWFSAAARRPLEAGQAAVCAAAILATACGSPSPEEAGWRLPATESFALQASATGHDFEIIVALPRGYADSTSTYPVLYVLDANGMFPIAVETARFLAFDPLKDEPVIVGIGYPVGLFRNTLGSRFRDFTPTADDEFMRRIGNQFGFPPAGSGGAAAFLSFLADDLVPAVERRYRIDPSRRALHGYSMGGLFATCVLFQRPALFAHYLIGAPSLWWDQDAVWGIEQAFADARVELPATVFLMAGALDGEHASIVRRLDGLFQTRQYRGLAWQTQVFDEETHNSAIPLTFSRGLRWLYGDLAPR